MGIGASEEKSSPVYKPYDAVPTPSKPVQQPAVTLPKQAAKVKVMKSPKSSLARLPLHE